ncbi:hypothetical protein FSP39_018960 [Pinctada imbricata]|uniref:Uncharacterized protein n=1 Tax=Pinctada imbricata TaxID=66713 RepID=A0AA88Y597_PINIB|nr:hypothetical protein FSP39_018960 [Pinctada imbricata]
MSVDWKRQQGEQSGGSSTSTTPKPIFEKTYKHFPARKIIKHQGRYDFQKNSSRNSPLKTPRIDPSPIRALVTQAHSDPFPRNNKFITSQRINGSVQLDHYAAPRDQHLAPLILPSIDLSTQDKMDAFTTSRMNMGTRSKIETSTAGSNATRNGTVRKGLKLQSEQTASHMHTTIGGHTPPPNSAEPPHKISAR